MVTNSRKTTRPGGLLPMNLPQPAAVEADAAGLPLAVLVRGTLRDVLGISDRWRIDDEWWRAEISRAYYALWLEGGMRLTVFHDLVADSWYTQQYTAPIRVRAG